MRQHGLWGSALERCEVVVAASAQTVARQGFGLLSGRLMTLMGHKATASMGAVVAHHSAPLGMVLRELRAAESRARNTVRGKDNKGDDINRDAFCLRVLKRGGERSTSPVLGGPSTQQHNSPTHRKVPWH